MKWRQVGKAGDLSLDAGIDAHRVVEGRAAMDNSVPRRGERART